MAIPGRLSPSSDYHLGPVAAEAGNSTSFPPLTADRTGTTCRASTWSGTGQETRRMAKGSLEWDESWPTLEIGDSICSFLRADQYKARAWRVGELLLGWRIGRDGALEMLFASACLIDLPDFGYMRSAIPRLFILNSGFFAGLLSRILGGQLRFRWPRSTPARKHL